MYKKMFNRKNEEGVSLVEVMVASTIILILLIASAQAFSTAFATAVVAGNRNQAVQFAQQVVSIVKQAPFEQVALVDPADREDDLPSQCETPYTGEYNGIPEIEVPAEDEYPGLVYCQVHEISGTDQVYVVYTHITPVTSTDFDNTTLPVTTNGTNYVPRRVTITVTWFNEINLDGSVNYESLTMSYIRTPTMAECIPPGTTTAPGIPPGCGGA